MYSLTIEMLILLVVFIILSSVLAFIYIAHIMKNDDFYKTEMTYFRAYFSFVLVSIIVGAYLQTEHIFSAYLASDITYMLASLLLVFALINKTRVNFIMIPMLVLITILAGINAYFMDHTTLVMIRGPFSFVIYGILILATIKRAKEEHNNGYYIMAAAFSLQIIASAFLLYEHNHHNKALADGAILLSSIVGFLLVGISFMTTILISAHNQMMNLALFDTLTGLNNRRGLDHLLQNLLPLMHRDQRELSAVGIDIDFFKKINDTYGHDGGDIVLREFGKHLQSVIRKSDVCCRFGGEEFVLLLPDTNKENAQALMENIRVSIEQLEIPFENTIIKFTASFGISTECGEINFDKMLKDADKGLYQSKKMGRNCISHYSDIIDDQ